MRQTVMGMINPKLTFNKKKHIFEGRFVDQSGLQCGGTTNDNFYHMYLSIHTGWVGPHQKAWIFPSLKHENLLFDVTKLQTQQYDTFNATIDEVDWKWSSITMA